MYRFAYIKLKHMWSKLLDLSIVALQQSWMKKEYKSIALEMADSSAWW